jgi:hypothetical protein
MPHGAGPALDLRLHGRLTALRALTLDSCMIPDAAPIAALAPRLVALEASLLLMGVAESEELEAVVRGMRALTRLELSHRPPYGASGACGASAFLRPLTGLQQLELHDSMGSMEPVGEGGPAAAARVRVEGGRQPGAAGQAGQ